MMLSAIAALVAAALLADGRPASESTTHDGGAWLLNRDAQVIGQVNRVVGEVAGVAGPIEGGNFEVDEVGAVIVVHDRTVSQAKLVNPATHGLDLSVTIPETAQVFASDGAIVVHDDATGAVWRLPTASLGEVKDVTDVAPQLQPSGPGRFVLAADFTPVLFDEVADSIVWLQADGTATSTADVGVGTRSLAMTSVGDAVVMSLDDGSIVVSRPSGSERFAIGETFGVLQQPSGPAGTVSGITGDGRLLRVDLTTGETTLVRALDGGNPLDLIVHDGCEWAVTSEPIARFHYCDQSEDLPGAGSELRLRLVNGWVWVNDATRGNVWFVDDDMNLNEIDDWTAALDANDSEDDTESESGGNEELVENPNADDLQEEVDQLDEDDQNESPQATDDEAETRTGRPVVVDVLANDTDADGDPLVVESIAGAEGGTTPDGSRLSITPDGTGIQVTPQPGFVGEVRFSYVVHDGRQGRDEATVLVKVIDLSTNRDPIPQLDNATVRAGESVTVNVLTNDIDPDGDVLVVTAVTGEGGEIEFTPAGEVSYRPDVTSAEGTVELTYDIVDDLGAQATGTLRVRVRAADSNQKPIARNDVGLAAVGRTIVLDVLANDADPDGDLLVAQNLATIDGSATSARLTPDGLFSFSPESAGVFRFSYLVSDGPSTDVAQIRIDVDAIDVNRPPTAVRDDVTMAVGETRLVRVLDNDGDPDGDVVGIVDWFGVDGLEIVEVPGIGFRVTATNAAAPRSVFTYFASDGTAEPVAAVVVVSVTPQPLVDHPPVARPDIIEVRAGQTTSIPVLRNDFDPDGTALSVAGPLSEIPEATLRIAPDGQSILITVAATQQFGFDFGYDIVDEGGRRASSTVEVRIVPAGQPNRAPIARPDIARTIAGSPVEVDVIINDTDPDGDPIRVESIAEQPANGTVEILEDGRIRYTPRRAFAGGTDRFTYTLVDGYVAPAGSEDGPLNALGEVLIGVMPEPPANRAPSAVDDSALPSIAIGSEGASLDVLANDTDPDNDRLTITSTTPIDIGALEITDAGRRIEFTPPADGGPRSVSFSYSISDGRGGDDTALVTLQLVEAPEPRPPVALDDSVGPVRVGNDVTFDPRVNDFDPDGSQSELTITPSSAFRIDAEGRVTITATKENTRVPYTVTDGSGLESEVAYITVLLTENEAPVVPPRTLETPHETPIVVALHEGVTDIDQDDLTYALGRNSTGGAVRVSGTPRVNFLEVQFTPDPGFSGAASFDFVVDDQNGHTVSSTVVINVLPPENRPPTARDLTVELRAGEPTPIDLSELVSDPDVEEGADDVLTYRIDSSSGSEVRVGPVTGAGVVTIESDVDAGGNSGSFRFTVTDSFGETASGNVSVSLATAADYAAPRVVDDTARTYQRTAVTVGPLDNDVDNSLAAFVGEGLTISAVGVSPDGTIARSADGSQLTFTPDPNFFGTATFSYTVQDGRRSSAFETTGNISVEVVGFPDAPQPPTIGSVGNEYLVINWQTPQGNGAPITNYRLDYEGSDGSADSVELGSATTNYRWSGLTNGVEYRFRVVAENEAGFGEPSALSLPGIPDVRPEAPGVPTAVFGDTQLRLTWAAALTQGTPVFDYQIEIGGGASTQRNTNGAVTTYTWDGLTNGVEYQFRVRARNRAIENDGWSEWSSWSASEHPLTIPAAPAAPVAVRGDGQVVISWGAPNDGGDTITRYDVQRVGSGTWVPVTPQGATNNYTWTDLTNGTPVQFQVRAVNRDPRSTGDGANVSPASTPVTPCAAPTAPGAPGVVTGDLRVTVSWVAPSNQGCAITSYTITASPGGATQTAAAGSTSHVFTGLTNGTAYTFTVAANNEVTTRGEMPVNTSTPSASVIPVGPPFATSITATPIAVGQIRLNWPAANPNGGAITTYEVSRDGGAWASVGNVLTTTVTGLGNNTAYSFRVRGVNSAGPGVASNSAGATTWGVPSAPGSISASAGNGTITMSFSAPGSNGGTAITRYEAKITTGATCDAGGNSTFVGGSPHVFGGLANGQPYRVCVRAENAVGLGAWSAATATPVAPAPPRTVSITTGGTGTVFGTTPLAGTFWINVTLSNFAPNTTYAISVPFIHSRTFNVTTNGAGSAFLGDGYYFCGNPFSGQAFADGVASPTYVCL